MAANGANFPPGFGIVSVSSTPGPGKRQWTFRIVSLRQQTLRTLVRCVRLRFDGDLVSFTAAVRTKRVRVRPQGFVEPSLRCPRRDQAPIGAGVSQSSAASPRASQNGGGRLEPYEKMPFRGGMKFGLHNPTAEEASGAVHLRCVKRTRRVRRGSKVWRHVFRILRRIHTDRIPQGANAVSHNCARGDVSLFTGYDFDPMEVDLLGTHPDRKRTGRWLYVYVQGNERERLTDYLLCLDQQTRFRRVRRRR